MAYFEAKTIRTARRKFVNVLKGKEHQPEKIELKKGTTENRIYIKVQCAKCKASYHAYYDVYYRKLSVDYYIYWC